MSSAPVPLSVLDLSPMVSGQTAADALRNTIDLAQHTERLGYRRYWLAEHHLASGIASASPAVLIALVAGATRHIRVGSGAVLLGHHAPLVVAEQFGTIAQLHPQRIDLGLGRSGFRRGQDMARRFDTPGNEVTSESRRVDGLLIPGRPKADSSRLAERLEEQQRLLSVGGESDAPTVDYKTQVQSILEFIAGDYRAADGEPVRTPPAEGADLDVWILGSSAGASSAAAAELGLPYAANYHVSPSTVLESVSAYRDSFVPSGRLQRPYVVVSADVVVAESDAVARELASPYGQWVLSIRSGEGAIPFPSPTEAAQFRWTDELRALVADRLDTQIVGGPETVVRQLRTLCDATEADELVITSITHDHADRVRSYELLAKAWEAAA
jgi:alkanesulfonate monooxygenase SsuD/methylene tetrahydromethanopterin reductase-like flavin-dependent oxidoreductase (luciferase family)